MFKNLMMNICTIFAVALMSTPWKMIFVIFI